jgi:ornithine--oxo-acid transaminase
VPYLDKAFFCKSGAEAVEGAIKFARAATRRSQIVYCDHAFHGLTMGALSLNGDELFRGSFEPLLSECVRVPFNDTVALERALKARDVAAFVFEPIQGKGVNLPGQFLPGAQRYQRNTARFFIADEIRPASAALENSSRSALESNPT